VVDRRQGLAALPSVGVELDRPAVVLDRSFAVAPPMVRRAEGVFDHRNARRQLLALA
jgi:hypothetical protein